MSVLGAFLAAFLVGTSDFLSRLNRHALRPLHITVFVMGGGAVFLYICLTYFLERNIFDVPLSLWYVGIVAGLVNFLAVLTLYTGLNRGPVAVVSPLSSTSTLFLAFEWFLVGFSLELFILFGIFLSVIGVIFVGYEKKGNDLEQGYSRNYLLLSAVCGLLAAIFFASRTFTIQNFMAEAPVIESLFIVRLFAFTFGISWSLLELIYQRKSISDSFKNAKPLNYLIVLTQSILESSGIFLLIYFAVGEYRVVVPAIFSVFFVVTILWSVIFLKETLSKIRMSGIAILLLGVLIMQISMNG